MSSGKCQLFPTLGGLLIHKEITHKSVALMLGITPEALSMKFQGKTEFTRREMWKIREIYFPNFSIDSLFG